MSDLTWTPDEAFRILRDHLERFIAGEFGASALHAWLVGTYATPPGTPRVHPANVLYALSVTDTAFFLQLDIDRSVLADSLASILSRHDAGEPAGPSRLMATPEARALFRSGQIPAPLIDLTAQNKQRQWEEFTQQLRDEGFEEV